MPTTIPTLCQHCGSACENDIYHAGELHFCCHGCKAVYQLFQESGNASYYKDRTLTLDDEKYSFLSRPDLAARYINFRSEFVNQVTFFLPAVHCSSCLYVLENLPRIHEGVIRLTLDFPLKKAGIYYDPQLISLVQLASLLDSIGYPPAFDRVEETPRDNSLLLKLGIAAFCFGNIMLLSFPSYLGMEQADMDQFGIFFQILMLLLSLPVVFYAGRDYFVTAFRSLSSGSIHIDVPIAIGILALFGRSCYEIFYHAGEGYLDSLSGLLFFLLLGKWFQNKAYRHLSFDRDYTSYFPLAVQRILANGEAITIGLGEIKEGHLLRIRNNEVIPADAKLVSEHAALDYSFVTGEDRLVSQVKDDLLYAGGRQTGPSILVSVVRPCSQSYLTQLWDNPAFTEEKDSSTTLLIRKISRYFTTVVLAIAIAAAVYWQLYQPDRMWEIVSAILIVACPCALALSSPFTNGNTLRWLGKSHFYLRNADMAENLGNIDTIVFDKTGTLTTSREGQLLYTGPPLTSVQEQWILSATCHSTHPVSRKITQSLAHKHMALDTEEFKEYPGDGLEAIVGGHTLRIGGAKWLLGRSGNEGRTFIEVDGEVAGYFQWESRLRDQMDMTLHHLSKHYELIILSGDNDRDRGWLEKLLPDNTAMFFNMSPFDKLTTIRKLQMNGKRVMMLGDGLNDAGALQQSEVGVAVTEDIGQFTPASDGIIDGESLQKLAAFMAYARHGRMIIKSSFLLSFIYNVLGIGLAISGMLTPVAAAILMPVSSISVVAFATVMGNYSAKKIQ